MQRIYSAQNSMMVDQMRDVLARQGIDSVVRNRDLAGLTGALPPGECWTELWVVDESCAAEAERLITAALQTDPPIAAVRPCRHCGEPLEPSYDTCWRCGASGDAAPPADFVRERERRISPRSTQRALFWLLWLILSIAVYRLMRS
ncbi:MAG: DUF2007 domain-containing protein [bacterium]